MKVLLVNKFHYEKGGSERYYFGLAKGFLNAGDQVIYFAMQNEKNFSSSQSKYFVTEKKIDGGIKEKLKFVASMNYSKEAYNNLTALLRQEKPDLVILNLVHKQLTLSVVKAIKDFDKHLPIFWTMHDYIAVCPAYTLYCGRDEDCEECIQNRASKVIKNKCVKGSLLQSVLAKREYNYIRKKGYYDLVDLYICPSRFMEEKLKKGGVTKSKIVTLINPLPVEVEKKNAKTNGEYLLYVGRLVDYKGIKTLIDAVKNQNKKLIVLGDGEDKEYLQNYVLENKIDVEFLGHKNLSEVLSLIDGAKAVCIPSIWQENCPYSALESFARYTPIIASNVGGLKELVIDGKNGFIFEGENQLEKAINKLYSLSDKEYGEMCSYAGEWANRFDLTDYIEKLKDYYKQIKDRTE